VCDAPLVGVGRNVGEGPRVRGVVARTGAAATAEAEADRRAVMLDAAQLFADGLRSTRALTRTM